MSKKWLALALKFLVSGFLIWFLMRNIDLGAAGERLADVSLGTLVAAGAVLLVQMVIGGFRWRAVSRAVRAPLEFAQALRLFYIGAFFNQTLPSSVGGDAVRIYMAYKTGLDLKGAVNGVMLERVAAVLALVILVDVTQPFFLSEVDETTAGWLLPAVVLVTFAAVAGLIFLMMLDRLPASLRHWRIVRGLAHLGGDTRRVFLNPSSAAIALFWGILTHVNVAFGVSILAAGLGLDITWLDCLVLMPPVLLVTTLPISIAGWGVREGAMVTAFALIGVPAEGALVLSVLLGLIVVVIALPGGLVWLAGRGRDDKAVSLGEVETELAAAEAKDP